MANKQSSKRLQKELQAFVKSPPPFVLARPKEDNILDWHFILRGPPDSVYAGGEYHGVLMFPSEYPFKPPGIKVFTPSGRFQPDRKICTSMSDFHPGSWNPAWSVATIDEITTGSVRSSDEDKKIFAAQSHAWNLKNAKFRSLFPEYSKEELIDLPNMAEKERGVPDSSSTSASAPTATAAAPSDPIPTDSMANLSAKPHSSSDTGLLRKVPNGHGSTIPDPSINDTLHHQKAAASAGAGSGAGSGAGQPAGVQVGGGNDGKGASRMRTVLVVALVAVLGSVVVSWLG